MGHKMNDGEKVFLALYSQMAKSFSYKLPTKNKPLTEKKRSELRKKRKKKNRK